MRVAIRADASVDNGTGHVMRCLAIAASLKKKGAEVFFICREQQGDLCDLIEARDFAVSRLPQSDSSANWPLDAEQTGAAILEYGDRVDWLIVDHYRLSEGWEECCRKVCSGILAIDDIAGRTHDCDLLLDQNCSAEHDSHYRRLVPPDCRLLLGPAYALLREEFLQERASCRQRDGALKRLLVFFGGSDPANETKKALEGIGKIDRDALLVDVVVGASNPHREQIRQFCTAYPNMHYHCQVDNMATLMAKADLAIGAGGISTWERCCVGLPALVAILADNQMESVRTASQAGAIINLGQSDVLTADDYRNAIESITMEQLREMQRCCLTLVDGKGTERIVDAMMQAMLRNPSFPRG